MRFLFLHLVLSDLFLITAPLLYTSYYIPYILLHGSLREL